MHSTQGPDSPQGLTRRQSPRPTYACCRHTHGGNYEPAGCPSAGVAAFPSLQQALTATKSRARCSDSTHRTAWLLGRPVTGSGTR